MTYADKLEKLADEAAAEEPEGYGVCCTKSFGEGHDDDCPWLYWYRNQHPARGKLASLGFRVEGEQWSQVIPDGIALARKVAALVRALERLGEAAEVYSALQDGATDKRVGVVQPITVAEGEELLAALEQARNALADIEGEGE